MPKHVDIHVGNRVRQARIMQGMSQTDLGVHLGVSFQQVQKYEKGTNRLSASRLWEAARALEHPVAWFFEGLEETGSKAGPVMTRQALELCRSFTAIGDPTVQNRVADLVKALGRRGLG